MSPITVYFSVFSCNLKLVSMAAACSWCDAVVEMQVWCQLADSCSASKEGSLVLVCTEKALSLEEAAAKDFKTKPCVL